MIECGFAPPTCIFSIGELKLSSNIVATSETKLMLAIQKYADAGATVIQVRTKEPQRAAMTLRMNIINSGTPHREWDIVNGFRTFTKENYTNQQIVGANEDFGSALSLPLVELRNPRSQLNAEHEKIHYFVYVDPHPYIANNPVAVEMIQQYAVLLPSTNVCLVFITNEKAIDGLPSGIAVVAELTTPNTHELATSAGIMIQGAIEKNNGDDFRAGTDIGPEELQQIARMGLGLSMFEFETAVAVSIIDAGQMRGRKLLASTILAGVSKGKTEVVRQSEILELFHPEDIENVGGMARLKDWLANRVDCFSAEAIDFGVEFPRGLGIVGVPGTGKSLVAKSIASVLKLPLVRFDIAKVYAKYVGESEGRIREALAMVERMAPVVLFVDEIDKALGGAGGDNDAGASSRVLGTFLTWLTDHKSQVFTTVTANRVHNLPVELTRRGRLDQVFSVGLPDDDERKEVLRIHMRRRQRDMADFPAEDIQDFVDASRGYIPAEIESAVKDGLVLAFAEKSEGLEMRHLLTALKEMVPISKSGKKQIDAILAWAEDNATPVNYPKKIAALGEAGGPRILRPRR